MKPHPRIRKTIKWGGAAVTALLLILALQTLHELRTWQSGSGTYVALGGGCVWIGRGPPQAPVRPLEYVVLLGDVRFGAGHWWIGLPLWVIAAIPTAIAWRLDTIARRRAGGRLNLCPNCTYDRTGLAADAKCPECGTLPAGYAARP